METSKKKIELLAPAGDFEKLEIAVHFGADAVYLAGKEFSLRNFSGNFTPKEMRQAISFAHENNVKVYVAVNIYSRNNEQEEISSYLEELKNIGPDAVIMADPGIIMEAGKIMPGLPIHLSTQSNTTNYRAVRFWEMLGVKRINMARELSLKEIKEISARCKAEIETFVHGAMCISYSGRCLLSSFLSKRDSNRGMCSHPCRWNYAVVEEQRPGLYMPFLEDGRGSYVFNSKDLCMIEHIPEMIEAGIDSLKIEGRMKGINYLASTVNVFRQAIDQYYADEISYSVKENWLKELSSINTRGYCTGFYLGDPETEALNPEKFKPDSVKRFLAKVIEKTKNNFTKIQVRNKIFTGDQVEIISSKCAPKKDRISAINDSMGDQVEFAQPGSIVSIRLLRTCVPNDLIRKAGSP